MKTNVEKLEEKLIEMGVEKFSAFPKKGASDEDVAKYALDLIEAYENDRFTPIDMDL